MKKEELSAAMSDIDLRFIEEAENYNMSKRKIIKRPLSRVAVAAIIITCIALAGGAAYAGASLTSWESVISFFDKDGNKTEVIVSDEAFFKELPDGLLCRVRQNVCTFGRTGGTGGISGKFFGR